MPQAIHESVAFNSRNREVAIHCVFSVKDNTLNTPVFYSVMPKCDSPIFYVSEVFANAKVKLLCEPPKLSYARFGEPRLQ